ncbi:hypothetical protein K504DRAFT_506810 [Pleomassaria siparia CBS 279.74]|uniref:Uncharacterized protein n=1 Tax=Pleomassaria siparia CBS 279.74 TaxID=1314801 RepID=A0A6G1JXE5_9PLEO|nr:hypothetical protein K504DRAFT_506810 [Pleomassaria siparia CBS 279.74]
MPAYWICFGETFLALFGLSLVLYVEGHVQNSKDSKTVEYQVSRTWLVWSTPYVVLLRVPGVYVQQFGAAVEVDCSLRGDAVHCIHAVAGSEAGVPAIPGVEREYELSLADWRWTGGKEVEGTERMSIEAHFLVAVHGF